MTRNGLVRSAGGWMLVAGLAGLGVQGAWAQANDASAAKKAKDLTYDVVSVKPNTSGTNNMRMMMSPDGFEATNTTLHMLMVNAYQFNPDLIFGLPKWGDSDHWDVKAKVAEEDLPALKKLGVKERPYLFQHALEERFKVAVHRETKEMPTYDLVIAKGGPKLKEAATDDTYPAGMKPPEGVPRKGMMRMGRGTFTAQGTTLESLVSNLSSQVHRPVVDKTGLKGVYDFELKWTPEDAPAGGDENGPSLFTALQEQLGLKLEPSKGPVETLVVDHVEKPSED